jgi:hypothetical protein
VKQKLLFSFRSDEGSSTKHLLFVVVCVIFIFAIIGSFHSNGSSALADSPEIKSGIAGECLDVHHSNNKPGAPVDSYSCNQTDAQSWHESNFTIINDSLCLSVDGNATAAGSKVVLENCSAAPGQIWLGDNGGLYNPNSKLCLDEPDASGGKPLIISSCDSIKQSGEQWAIPALDCDSLTTRGTKVACYAVKEWQTWQTGNPSHKALLTTYTDGAPYEEWCADFVSYIYKEAGYPFVNGEADGWDESNANLVQTQGFTQHDPSNYTPVVGDVAFFDYTGGHVEIVISGGPHPTFVYGNSAIIDPTTGNGQMEANTITKDGSLGSLVYYLSPN